MRQIFRRHSHGERDWKIYFAAPFDSAATGLAEVRAAGELLAVELDAIELQVKLEAAVIEAATQLIGKGSVVRDPDTIRVKEEIIDSRICARPTEEVEELRMQRRFTSGKLKNLDVPLAIDHALDSALEIRERNCIYLFARADW